MRSFDLTSASGETVATYAYGVFGELTDSDEDRPQSFRYLGRYGIMDDGNGLYHAQARYFNPHLGRFISQDPLWGNDSSSQSWNRYAYALNNPMKYFDPLGLSSKELNLSSDSSSKLDILSFLTSLDYGDLDQELISKYLEHAGDQLSLYVDKQDEALQAALEGTTPFAAGALSGLTFGLFRINGDKVEKAVQTYVNLFQWN